MSPTPFPSSAFLLRVVARPLECYQDRQGKYVTCARDSLSASVKNNTGPRLVRQPLRPPGLAPAALPSPRPRPLGQRARERRLGGPITGANRRRAGATVTAAVAQPTRWRPRPPVGAGRNHAPPDLAAQSAPLAGSATRARRLREFPGLRGHGEAAPGNRRLGHCGRGNALALLCCQMRAAVSRQVHWVEFHGDCLPVLADRASGDTGCLGGVAERRANPRDPRCRKTNSRVSQKQNKSL